MDWQRIHPKNLPLRGTVVLVFTPSNAALRYRLCDSELLRTMSEATHWAYPQPPDDFWEPDNCHHEWVDMRNPVITNGEMCRKCFAIRP